MVWLRKTLFKRFISPLTTRITSQATTRSPTHFHDSPYGFMHYLNCTSARAVDVPPNVLNRCPRSFRTVIQQETDWQTDGPLKRKALSLGGARKHTMHALNVFKSKNQTTHMYPNGNVAAVLNSRGISSGRFSRFLSSITKAPPRILCVTQVPPIFAFSLG